MNDSTRRIEIIAEAGTAHNGSLSKAHELIHAAAEAGADTVKFQYVIADEIIHPLTGSVPLPGGTYSLYDKFRRLEQPPEFYAALAEECERSRIRFLCSPFGLTSLARLVEIGADRLKIASPELNHTPLLRAAAATGLPLILSTGVSRLADMEEALDICTGDVTLLHCVTSYPAPPTEYNLNLLPHLSGLFGCPVGISDHSLDPEMVPVLAAARGACMIEKHITLSRRNDGLDDPIALEPWQFHRMTQAVRQAERQKPRIAVRKACRKWGREMVDAVMGDGRKKLAEAERENYGRTNRSIHLKEGRKAGHLLTPEDLAVLRTEKVLRPGLHPRYLDQVTGCRLSREVASGEGIVWEDLLTRTGD